MGIPIGIALDNIAIGVAIGGGMGVSLGVAFAQQNKERKSAVPKSRRITYTLLFGFLSLVLVGLVLLVIFLGKD